MNTSMQVSVVLHDIRSMHNVGSIFRTADGAGVSKIYITGYTPAPVDRFNRPVREIAKVALGAEQSVPWEKCEITELIQSLRKDGVQVVAVEQSDYSIPYTTFKLTGDTALIFGNEVGGLADSVVMQCDTVVEIPMHGTKESLNVSVAAGIVLYQLAPQA